MNIEEMKQRKKELGYSNKKISELSGVPVGTIQKIFSGETSSPRYDTIQALTSVLEESFYKSILSETASPYGSRKDKKKNFMDNKNIDDYIALPEGTRVELIDGKFYNMSAPSTIHQYICDEILFIFKAYVKMNKGKCVPYSTPVDVQLDCDDKTMVQPDVLIVCDRDKITGKRIYGAPDLVVEVVSMGNVTTDVFVKLKKYKQAGVKEYWIVFPDEKKVMVYEFEKDSDPVEYTFEDHIPVGIWKGKCKVNFKEIDEQIKLLYKESN